MKKSQNDTFEFTVPFPIDWIDTQPHMVENFLEKLTPEEQAREILRFPGRKKMDLVILSQCSKEVMALLPEEEVYQMVKDAGESESLAILSIATEEQLQYIFDLDWWRGDKFCPSEAVKWIDLLDQCGEPQWLKWLVTEEFEQKVMVMQSLMKVYKNDEMTDSYEGVENLEHYTLDGVYDIYFKVEETGALKKFLMLLRSTEEEIYFSLMEAIIWYPVTQTIERAYHWRSNRTAERGIPEFDEAMQIYSPLNPSALTELPPDPEDLRYFDGQAAPLYPMVDGFAPSFLKQSLLLLDHTRRMDALGWEMVLVANKVMVADKKEPSQPDARNECLRKAMAYINIGLEVGAEGDPKKGARLLEKTWVLSLFQVGHERLLTLKATAQKLIYERGEFLEYLIPPTDKERLAALVERFPLASELGKGTGPSWSFREFQSLEEIVKMEDFLERQKFHVRFATHVLSLLPSDMDRLLVESSFPEDSESMNIVILTSTALARFVMFKEISCEPLNEIAAKSFIEMFFLPNIHAGDIKQPQPHIEDTFIEAALQCPMAWTEDDQRYCRELISYSMGHLCDQLGGLNPKGTIEWRYIRAICVKWGRKS
jgi:hypothetical protein